MNYSTLQEAYNIDSFEKKSRPSQKPNKNNGSMVPSTNTSPHGLSSQSGQSMPSYVESSKLALNSNKLGTLGTPDFPNSRGNSCSPLQAPNYNIPISNECKKEHDEAMSVYVNANNNTNNTMNTIPKNMASISSMTNNIEMLSQQSASASDAASAASANLFNNLKSSNDNVAPYYDEDLEQYFNIADLNDEVKYNSSTSFSSRTNAYMPNSNKQPYTNNDTTEYTNNNALIKNGNNLLNNSSYNLSQEEKKNAQDAILFLKSIEDKINNGDANASGFNKSSIADPVVPTINTGPGGFKTQEKADEKPVENTVVDKSANNYIYNAIFNISILLIVGIAIIILCDQMVELSIQIGMKRVVNILEPFIKAQAAHAAHAAMHAQAAQAMQAIDGAIITNR